LQTAHLNYKLVTDFFLPFPAFETHSTLRWRSCDAEEWRKQLESSAHAFSRRRFLTSAGTAGVAAAIGAGCATELHPPLPKQLDAEEEPSAGTVAITLRVNGQEHKLKVDPRTTVLDCLRETIHLTGTKKGCDHGQCGACTVHINGRRINSCLTLAVASEDDEITTIEGIGTPEQLHPMQEGAGFRYLAGGTTLIDLMKLNVEMPTQLLDINRLPLDKIERNSDGSVKIGATVRNADLANHPIINRDYPVLSQALLSGASAQLRNMATTAGNLLQRTRCVYFRDPNMPCNKRTPGSGCPAIKGQNRALAILGTSEHCIATNPSDMNVAMIALEAVIHVQGIKGHRDIPIGDFHLLPGNTPHRETVLELGDLITHVTLPKQSPGSKSVYLKLRDRASYEFALASAAVVVSVEDRTCTRARIALGGVGTKPWRSPKAENALVGQSVNGATFKAVAEAALAGAKPQSENGFKIELARRCLMHALKLATS
jgi:xanthine dehydrogenase YagS FAD-binding subunit